MNKEQIIFIITNILKVIGFCLFVYAANRLYNIGIKEWVTGMITVFGAIMFVLCQIFVERK